MQRQPIQRGYRLSYVWPGCCLRRLRGGQWARVRETTKLQFSRAAFSCMVAVLIIICASCSGINAKGTVSPASFFLPGIIQAEPHINTPSLPESTNQFEAELVLAE